MPLSYLLRHRLHGKGVGLLKIGNLTQDRWDIDFERQRAFISQETSQKFPKTILEEGDLIMAARGATIGIDSRPVCVLNETLLASTSMLLPP